MYRAAPVRSIRPAMDVKLPDGTVLALDEGATGADAAAAIGPGLARSS
jgi:threonyl-tRNA synthetase